MLPAFPDGLRCRAMSAEDIPALLPIENAGQPTPWTAQIFADCLCPGYRCHVVVAGEGSDETPVAFQVLSHVLDEAHLLNIAVHPDWQRRGIAATLLQHTLAGLVAADISVLYLEVRESNLAGRQLYERLGFALTGRRKDYYTRPGGREDALLMLRHL
ncbi:ribosomal protein S18-alanine N-acetyltransferase [Alcanivorax limicola]|uniref:ribosomal protein S18-alanine N-acetyltransferase n=1 Tax=Alcanivorax limicola TaxID=2874102 RepID=UPI001CBDE3DB|nr:ribosomal protein S18-alanine N-acetyltransferase [Alcanivorax limicola]